MFSIMKDGWLWSALAGVAALSLVGASMAEGRGEDREDQDEVRALKDMGDILSLEQVMERVRAQHDGRILEAELEREDGRYVYEIELLDEQGRVREMYYDAKNGEALTSGYGD